VGRVKQVKQSLSIGESDLKISTEYQQAIIQCFIQLGSTGQKTNAKNIADTLGISISTVKLNLKKIMESNVDLFKTLDIYEFSYPRIFKS
jgi:DNA-binding NarL/FixJ family response regulator